MNSIADRSCGQTCQDLGPFNVDNQQIRRRFWDGHDNMFRDDVSMLKGNHLFQFGGTYQHNWDYHQRNDSGGTINAFPVYSLGDNTNGSLLGVPSGATATSILAPQVLRFPTVRVTAIPLLRGRWELFPMLRRCSPGPVRV